MLQIIIQKTELKLTKIHRMNNKESTTIYKFIEFSNFFKQLHYTHIKYIKEKFILNKSNFFKKTTLNCYTIPDCYNYNSMLK